MNIVDNLLLNDDVDVINPLEPIKDVYLDTVSTIHPYLTWRAFLLNLLQPVLGGINIIKGGILAGLGVICLCFSIPVALLYDPLLLGMNGLWILHNMTLILRGASQIVATPLTWAIKMPIRLVSSLIHLAKGDTHEFLIENSEEVQEMVKDQDIEGLHHLFIKGVARGEATGIDRNEEHKIYQTVGYDPMLNHGNGGYGYGKKENYYCLFRRHEPLKNELPNTTGNSVGSPRL